MPNMNSDRASAKASTISLSYAMALLGTTILAGVPTMAMAAPKAPAPKAPAPKK